FAKADFNDPVNKLADARPYRIGGVTNDAKVMWLREQAVTNIGTVNEDKLVPPMLTLDRKKLGAVDLRITRLEAGKNRAAADGVKDVKLVLKVRQESLWFACNPTVSNDTVKSLATALAGMNKDGSYQKIIQQYEKKFAP